MNDERASQAHAECGKEANHPLLPVIAAETSQELCKRCALCCDGTLFSRVPLQLEEVEPIRNLGFDVNQSKHPAYIAQPCAKLDANCCSVYNARSRNCRGYQCRVLQRLESGELTADGANALVLRAKTLLTTIVHHIASASGTMGNIWTRLEAFAQSQQLQLDGVEFCKLHPLVGMNAMLLKRIIDEEFRPKKREGDEI